MLNEMQLVIAVAGVCVLALALIVLSRRRRRRNAADRTDAPRVQAAEAVETAETVETAEAVEALEVDEPGRLVLARTHDGTQYQGVLAEPDEAHAAGAFLVLAGPIVFRRSGGESETMPSAWDRLAVPLVDVAEVWTRSARIEPTATHQRGDDTDDTDRTSAAPGRSSRWDARETSNAAVPTS
jgi:hypothetical protein